MQHSLAGITPKGIIFTLAVLATAVQRAYAQCFDEECATCCYNGLCASSRTCKEEGIPLNDSDNGDDDQYFNRNRPLMIVIVVLCSLACVGGTAYYFYRRNKLRAAAQNYIQSGDNNQEAPAGPANALANPAQNAGAYYQPYAPAYVNVQPIVMGQYYPQPQAQPGAYVQYQPQPQGQPGAYVPYQPQPAYYNYNYNQMAPYQQAPAPVPAQAPPPAPSQNAGNVHMGAMYLDRQPQLHTVQL